MDIEITQQVDNKLFDRQDVKFVMWHTGETTPSRNKVRDLVAGKLGAKSDAVIIDHMESASGMAATRGEARAYKSLQEAKKHERSHFIARNVKEEAPAAEDTADEAPEASAKEAAEEPAGKDSDDGADAHSAAEAEAKGEDKEEEAAAE